MTIDTPSTFDAILSGNIRFDDLRTHRQLALEDGSVLTILEPKRQLPDRRFVCRGLWNKQSVYAKIFFGKDAKKYALRDKQGVQLLLDAAISTPRILYFGKPLALTSGQLCYVLILEEISAADNVEVLWHSLGLKSERRLQLATHLVAEVAHHHHQGLMQTDLYLKNFIFQNDVIYTLDGDGIQALPSFNRHHACLRNLSVLLSKFDVLEIEKWLPQLLKTYADTRGWQTPPALVMMQGLIHTHRIKVSSTYADKKVFRTCTDVAVTSSPGQFLAVVRNHASNSVLGDVPALDKCLQDAHFKSGNTCTVGLITQGLMPNDAQKIVIKRYNIKSLWHGAMRSFRKTRAATSWANAHRLKLLGLPAIQPISLLEERFFFGRLRAKSYFLSEYIDAPDVDAFFAAEPSVEKRAEVVAHLVMLFYRLYLLNISHGDMKASNIKIVGHQPVLIDLDSMKQHTFGWFATRRHARDLRRFMRNWQADETLIRAFNQNFKLVYADHQPLQLAHVV